MIDLTVTLGPLVIELHIGWGQRAVTPEPGPSGQSAALEIAKDTAMGFGPDIPEVRHER